MHRYAWPEADDFLNKVTELHERYGKPIWVTVYAVADWDATASRPSIYSRAQNEDFMGRLRGRGASDAVRRTLRLEGQGPTLDPKDGMLGTVPHQWHLTSTGRLYASL